MIPVRIKSVTISDIGFVLFLKNEDDERVLPIFLGPVEAQAITMTVTEVKPRRPLTHDLFVRSLEAVHQKVVKVEITDIKNETFFALLYLQHQRYAGKSETGLQAVDARPSDAITLALKTEAPIFVAEHLLRDHGVTLPDGSSEAAGEDESDSAVITRSVNEQLGIYQKMLDEAVKEDRFEDAAQLRLKIENLMGREN